MFVEIIEIVKVIIRFDYSGISEDAEKQYVGRILGWQQIKKEVEGKVEGEGRKCTGTQGFDLNTRHNDDAAVLHRAESSCTHFMTPGRVMNQLSMLLDSPLFLHPFVLDHVDICWYQFVIVTVFFSKKMIRIRSKKRIFRLPPEAQCATKQNF